MTNLPILGLLALIAFSNHTQAENLCTDTSSTATTGNLFDSGGAGSNYGNNENCSFLIQPAGGGTITLSFSQFDTQNPDPLTVYDGTDATGTLLATLSSNTLPADVVATSGAMFVVFTSNAGGTRAGFSAAWSVAASSVSPSTEWRFDESSWTGVANEVVDSVGGFSGTSFNATTVVGQVCNAGDFSANSTTDYVSVDNGALNGTTDFSISVWARTGNSGSQAIFSGSSGSQHNELIMWFPNSSTFTPFLKGSGSGSISITSISDSNWHHLVWTRSGAQNCLYRDAVLQGCSNKSTQALSIAAGGLIIGQEQDSLGGGFAGNQDWEGLLDEPLIFKSALTQSDITSIYNNQLAGNGWDGVARSCPGVGPLSPRAEWRFDEASWNGTADEVADSSGNNYHGVAQNASPVPGLICNAADLSANTNNDFLSMNNGALNGLADFSISIWGRTSSIPTFATLVSGAAGNTAAQANELYMILNGATAMYPGISEEFFNGTPTIGFTPAANDNQWHHFVWTRQASTRQSCLYVDGAFQGCITNPDADDADPLSVQPGGLILGQDQDVVGGGFDAGQDWEGLIDEALVFDSVLSAGEVQSIFNNQSAGNNLDGTPRNCGVVTPVAEWRLDEASWNGTAGEVVDSTGNGHDGVALNTSPVPGQVCNAADLTANSITDYLSLGNGALNGVGDFTLSIWSNNANGNSRALISGSSGAQNNELIMWIPNATTFQPFLKGSSSGGNISIPNIADSQWHHYVWRRSGAQNCLYRDGVSQGCANRSTSSLNIAAGGLIIGQEQDSLGGGFAINQDWEGLVDEIVFFDSALSDPEIQSIYNNNLAGNGWDGSPRSCQATVDHFAISHAGSAATCDAASVTLSAHLADHSVDTSYISTGFGNIATLTTSTGRGDWSLVSGNGTLNNGVANDGTATYAFVAADNGSVALALKNTTAEALNINVTDGSISEQSGSALATEDQNLVFSETGFRFLNDSDSNTTITEQIAAKASNINPGLTLISLQAVRSSDNDPSVCVAAFPDGSDVALELAAECRNPTSCAGGTFNITNNSNTTSIAVNNDNGGAATGSYTPTTLRFGTDAKAPLVLNYSDAGQMQLHARFNIPLDDGSNTPSGNFMLGSSNDFVVKPAGLCVETSDVNASCAPPYISSSCLVFRHAGEAFNLTVRGVAWEATGESNTDFCSGNDPVPNFQLSGIALSSAVVEPIPGQSGAVGVGSASISSGGSVAIGNQSISEVGVFTITAAPPSYIEMGVMIPASVSANIGRFTPHRFLEYDMSMPVINEACTAGGFTYMGQQFSADYVLEAVNESGARTQNYKDDFALLGNGVGAFNFGALDSVDLSIRLNEVSTNVSWVNGLGNATSTLRLDRASLAPLLDGPFNAQIGVLPADADGITMVSGDLNFDIDSDMVNDLLSLGISDQRYGRLVIENAFGPEVLPLSVPVHTDFWNGTNFVVNTDDVCTGPMFTTSDFTIMDADTGDSLTTANVTPMYQSIVSGQGSLDLSAPGAGRTGPLRINLDVPAWLEFDFGGDGITMDPNDNPSAEAVFGQYRGNDRIIYWREVFGN